MLWPKIPVWTNVYLDAHGRDGVITEPWALPLVLGLSLSSVKGLPQVVVETTAGQSTAYLYGHDLLAEEGTAWAWHLNDGPSTGSGQAWAACGS